MDYIIHYDVAAFVITLAITLHFCFKKSIDTYRTQLFSLLVGLELVSSALDLVTMYTINNPQVLPNIWHYILNGIYLLSFNATSAVYFAYIVSTVKKKRKIKPLEKALILLPFCIDVLLTATTPGTGLIFVITETGEYVHGPLFLVLYANAMLYVLSSQVYSVVYRAIFTRGQLVVVCVYTISSFVVLVIQMMFPNLMIAQFAVAIAVFLIYLSLENPQDYTEREIGTYNKAAFEKILTADIENERHFSVFAVELGGMQYISETLGIESANGILKQLQRRRERERCFTCQKTVLPSCQRAGGKRGVSWRTQCVCAAWNRFMRTRFPCHSLRCCVWQTTRRMRCALPILRRS